MEDKITGAFEQGKSLHLTQGSGVWSVKDNGKEPNQWKVVHFAQVGTSEPFVEEFSGEILELVDASMIFDEQRQTLKDAIMTILLEGLMPAFGQT